MNREVKVIIPNMREFSTFYSDNEGVIGMFFKRDWVAVKEDHWKPSEEQVSALERAIVKAHTRDDIATLSELRDNLKDLIK